MPDYAIPTDKASQWRLVERRLEEAGMVGYQRMVVCSIFEHENVAAALNYIDAVKGLEVSDGTDE